MSRVKSHDRSLTESGETLAVIREEQFSPTASSVKIDANFKKGNNEQASPPPECICPLPEVEKKNVSNDEDFQKLLKEKEEELHDKFNKTLEHEITLLKEKFDYILQNEQVRTSYMLCEAHRERREKIRALQTQLECKNLAGLMYVMCSERRRGKFEKMRMAQDYTKYIEALQNVLTDAQALILRLVRVYKAATNVDNAWRNKMKNVIREFQNFVHNFVGGVPGVNQYFFDLSKLIKSELPDISGDDSQPDVTPFKADGESIEEKPWWDMMDGDQAPFIMYGDMAEFQAPLRRNVLKALKAEKTERKGLKDYVFNDKFLKSECPNADFIKDEYLKHLPKPGKWQCCTMQPQDGEYNQNFASRRITQASVDIRGNMGSVLRIIASTGYGQPITKATLLGARDSMEIASTTKLRERTRNSDHNKVILNIGNKRSSKYEDYDLPIDDSEEMETLQRQETSQIEEEERVEASFSVLGSVHNDSLHVIPSHVPDQDSKINYEKVCPMEICQRMQVDSFIRSLPPYMRANPYTHFENTFEEYEACTPEELEVLKQRIQSKKKRVKADTELEEPLLDEWIEESNAVAVQTSDLSLSIPSCTCHEFIEEPNGRVYNIEDLLPVKRAIDEINKKFFFDSNIEFNRFKVVGQDADDGMNGMRKQGKMDRIYEIKDILKNQPSLCDIFQGNTR